MKYHFLHTNKDSKDLVLFFGGFASHFSHFSFLRSSQNVVICYDYSNFTFDFNLSNYENITLIAYSMGVCVASKILQNHSFQQTIAINGTNYGIHKIYGIHPAIFRQTIKNFCLANFKTALFMNRSKQAQDFIFADEEHLKKELNALYEFCSSKQNKEFEWHNIIISEKDRIFPPQSCKNFFLSQNKLLLQEPHYPFFAFQTWEDLCSLNPLH